ncbi:uncharacterized protein LOC132783458 isoform X1 [Drosophila nasuta]|uniref:uncharacterized protein LOC132783458 isoform X1 n=1 Tax=Drosophila nasuta TaxID=42062 RepID=UPI00295EC22A|nr:uncharacterized protein LOC132783458 isoform X1 [Drosophila nasuta]XP_060644602.1 uncharacterized protein LOC132783458 isoform X1 [Drosophila nasuta]XP_060644603.1 uncharacterized protein LOC132783458 isoform X1 [Drosophila nasuta]
MFSLRSNSQIYGLPQATTTATTEPTEDSGQKKSNSLPHKTHKQQQQQQQQHRRSTSSLSDTGGKFFANLSAKSPSQFIEKFIRSELLNGYDTLKCQSGGGSGGKSPTDKDKSNSNESSPLYSNLQTDWSGFSCLQGSYRSHGDGEFYEAVHVKSPSPNNNSNNSSSNSNSNNSEANMRCKSTNGAATLQHYQKLPETSLEANFNTQAAGHTPAYKKLGFGARLQKQSAENNSDNSQSSSNTTRSSSEVQRSSSGSSSSGAAVATTAATPERLQRRRLLQMISNYDQQNKQLHRELAKEKRRRTEELACVVKSLLCFESKLKNDMKTVNQRLLDRDAEICRLLRQNRALRKRLVDHQKDEGMVADQETNVEQEEQQHVEECLVLEALQCNNCRKQFYDIELRASGTQTSGKELGVSAKAEHGSSSDDTVSSSFYGARRSVRYTSKRTAGTFRDYMRSRAMQIDDAALEQQSEENTSSISREDSQTSYEQLHNYARAMERMHGVKATMQDGDYSEHSSLELEQQQQQQQRRRNSSSSRSSSKTASSVAAQLEEDDGIFSPTQDDEDFDELDPEQEQQLMSRGAIKIVQRRCAEFSEASPKQIYETTTDDWYASASDQEELSTAPTVSKPYGQGAVNPVLECVNQILLQQSMEETLREPATPKSALAPKATSNLPRRSSLSGRSGTNGRKRVHFSTKNSMVHVPRHEDEEEAQADELISHYHPMAATVPATTPDTLNYESIYSNEYEPIGSERASNLYVDMAAAATEASNASNKTPQKLPPALPPKPANLLKFKKSLQQLEELEDEGDCAVSTTTTSEPDYCSIAEVGVSVQIVADVHKVPESNTPTEPEREREEQHVVDDDDDDACSAAASHKTEEIEEIFADIPKLPNVAAIIAPKQSSDYLLMAPKTLRLQLSPLNQSTGCTQTMPSQYKRKHVPNILAEINKRMSLPSSPTTPTTPKSLPTTPTTSKSLLQLADASGGLPLQAEFDWYNLDAEYDRSNEAAPKSSQGEGMLEEISEDNECLVTAADEYNLDEEFQQEEREHDEAAEEEQQHLEESMKPEHPKAKQMKKNLASFEKFIEGSGLSTKPLPSKRKIYFNAPFV